MPGSHILVQAIISAIDDYAERETGKRAGGPHHRARGTPLSAGAGRNDLWCADFKGEFKVSMQTRES